MSNPIESKLVIQYLDNGEWKDLSSYALTDIQTAYNVYNQLTSSKSTLDAYRLVNVKVDLLAANQATEAK